MDPLTLAIVSAITAGAAAGVTKVGEQAIVDAYARLKELLKRKYGIQSQVVKALEGVETRPDSDGRKGILKEEVNAAKADQDTELLAAAQALIVLINKSQGNSTNSTVINQQAGDNAMQIGQVGGSVSIKK